MRLNLRCQFAITPNSLCIKYSVILLYIDPTIWQCILINMHCMLTTLNQFQNHSNVLSTSNRKICIPAGRARHYITSCLAPSYDNTPRQQHLTLPDVFAQHELVILDITVNENLTLPCQSVALMSSSHCRFCRLQLVNKRAKQSIKFEEKKTSSAVCEQSK